MTIFFKIRFEDGDGACATGPASTDSDVTSPAKTRGTTFAER